VNCYPLRPTGPAPRRPREIREPKANPRNDWPRWTDFVSVSIVEDSDDYRPTAGPEFTPTTFDEAEWLGMALRLTGEPMAEIATSDTSLCLRFAIGQLRGLEARHEADWQEWEFGRWADLEATERMLDAFGDPADSIHDAESCGIC
jgi:hypothetical protein